MSRKYDLLNYMLQNDSQTPKNAETLAKYLSLDRSTISRYLNQLVREKLVMKTEGRPVLYFPATNQLPGKTLASKSSPLVEKTTSFSLDSFSTLIGYDKSLSSAVQKAKAAILYPPNGLHTLILGETGVGKSYFAKKMHEFSIMSQVKSSNSPFTTLNCADFADNPQLLISQIFGSKKGAYTGADKDRDGLLKISHGGFLFLDEVHRLPPQGQEMLFTYIDHGFFRELGSLENVYGVKVQIIAATTEKTDSYLLDTFTRRIPMVIELPPLAQRSLAERYQLVSNFIKEESLRISKSIHFSRNALISFLLYDCKNNIGQLKSDIQLSCAKGFLSYMTHQEAYIQIRSRDIPEKVKKGLFKYKSDREHIDHLIPIDKDLIKFHFEESLEIHPKHEEINTFYDSVDSKIQKLKSKGIDDLEIKRILNMDLDDYFNSFIEDASRPQIMNNLEQIVGSSILELSKDILSLSSDKLGIKYSNEILAGLSMHIKSAIERIRNGESISNPNLNDIRVKYQKEFIIAMESARLIETQFEIILPLDEIGYLTMFIIGDYLKSEKTALSDHVMILSIMHGNSTASSMTAVVNELIGQNYALAMDMPLSTPVDVMYAKVKDYILSVNPPKGTLLMVDMGSLSNFSDMLFEDAGIISRTIDMTSTPLLLDVTRKALNGHELNDIVESIKSFMTARPSSRISSKPRKYLILTACFTGEGASDRLKRILEDKLDSAENIMIQSINIGSRQEFLISIDHFRDQYHLLAVVSTIHIELEDIPVFNALEVLDGSAITSLNQMVTREMIFSDVSKSIRDNITLDSDRLVAEIRILIEKIEFELQIQIHKDSVIGLILHIAFMIDTLKNSGHSKLFKELDTFQSKYGYEMNLIKDLLKPLELEYAIHVNDHEIAHITNVVVHNKIVCD